MKGTAALNGPEGRKREAGSVPEKEIKAKNADCTGAGGKYILNRILYTLIQLTWGILQNAAGVLALLVMTLTDPRRKHAYYHGALVTHWKFPFSMGLGMFIFYGHAEQEAEYAAAVLVHEYGHTIQSCILGPLFLPVIGIPSCVWAFTPVFVKWRKEGRYDYLQFYPEAWANHEGERVLKMPAPRRRVADGQ
ncbi:MAG: hypothetical protein CW338_04340 [Clostridiales bacterium]|nr:hypothetical protein [Clostridiales bacterium]